MLDANMIIGNNIQAELKKENKKQVDLAEEAEVSKQTMSKIMNGAKAINAIELHKISEYLHVSIDSLMKMPKKPMDMNVIHAFMGRVKTEEARKGIQLADELSDMILFHTRVCENAKKAIFQNIIHHLYSQGCSIFLPFSHTLVWNRIISDSSSASWIPFLASSVLTRPINA